MNSGGVKKVHILKGGRHKGCRENVKDAFDYIFSIYEQVIYIEDDICVAPDFLDFMEECLIKLKTDERVYAICGYTPNPLEGKIKEDLTLIGRFTAWGTGLWKDRWEKVDYERSDYYKDDNLMEGFKEYGYDLPNLLMTEEMDILDTWDVQVMLASYRLGMYTVYPRLPKCTCIGKYGVHSHDRYDEEGRPFYTDISTWMCSVGNINVNKDYNEIMRCWVGTYEVFEEWKLSKSYRKYLGYNHVLKRIIKLKQDGIQIENIFFDLGAKNISVYGFTDIGEILCKELLDSEIKIVGYIDRNPIYSGKKKDGIKIYSSPEEVADICDCVVITPLTDCYEIKKHLTKFVSKEKIFTIAELLR